MDNLAAKGKRRLASAANQPPPKRLPRGSSSLPRAVVELEQRKRLVLGTAKVVAEQGYAAASVAQIISCAGVSRATFYALFRDKEACFLYGFGKLSNAHLEEVERAINGPGALPQRLQNAVSAYLRRINVDHHLARAFIVEAQAATPQVRAAFNLVLRRLHWGLQSWVDQVRQAYPEVPVPSATDLSLVLNGLQGHVIDQVRNGNTFSNEQIVAICRFVFAALGMAEWAKHVQITAFTTHNFVLY